MREKHIIEYNLKTIKRRRTKISKMNTIKNQTELSKLCHELESERNKESENERNAVANE